MLTRAVVDIGLSPDEFWELSWYELGLYQLQWLRKQKEKTDLIEHGWAQTRILWATIINRHRGKNERARDPKDLIRLSFDPEEKEKSSVIEPEKVDELFVTTIPIKVKKNGK